jgi:Glycosyl hydrolase family 79, N-terminal domain
MVRPHVAEEGALFGRTPAIGVHEVRRIGPWLWACLISTLLTAPVCPPALADALTVTPATMARTGTVDERFQSYNVEMVEVTGGRFWRPYGPSTPNSQSDLYAWRPPIDLTDPRLRMLAAALAPAYMRVSGTWANATFFADSDTAPPAPPAGFNGVLSRRQWRGVVDFAQSAGAAIVTSFAISPGTRDAAGVWTPEQARRLLAYTKSVGGPIAAAEFMNEPNLAAMGGAPAGYDAAAYGRDFQHFRWFVKQNFSDVMVLGPGTVGETAMAAELLVASRAAGLDAFSYHHYGALSERCRGSHTPEDALSEQWLARTDHTAAFYRVLRDRFEPGKPIWLTETAETACGGNRWAATFLDTFRYLDQLGRLAKAGVQVVMHNTLAASDYGLLDESTLAPRPNYWGALLWRQLMGTGVLEPGAPLPAGLHIYAHCQRGAPGGVTLLVINTDRDASHTLQFGTDSERYTLEAAGLQDAQVRLNGRPLALETGGELPRLQGVQASRGSVPIAPASITFLAIPGAANKACL